MVKDLKSDASKNAGWTTSAGSDVFNGTAALTQEPSQTLADFLGAQAGKCWVLFVDA